MLALGDMLGLDDVELACDELELDDMVQVDVRHLRTFNEILIEYLQ